METVYFLQSFAAPWIDALAQAISDLGSEQGYIALLLAVYLGYDARVGQRVGAWLLLSFALNFHLKELFATPRPFEIDAATLRSTEEDLGAGFPSGHAQAAATFWGYLATRVHRAWFWAAAALVVAAISLTRVYLGVHIPIDVVGGLLIGAAVVAAARGVDRAIRGREAPAAPLLIAGIGVPLLANVLLPPPGDEKGLLMGGLAAVLTAPLLYRHTVPRALWRRIAIVALGVALALSVLTLTSIALPEAVKVHAVGGFLRYLVLGYAGLLLVPWLGDRLGLTSSKSVPRMPERA